MSSLIISMVVVSGGMGIGFLAYSALFANKLASFVGIFLLAIAYLNFLIL